MLPPMNLKPLFSTDFRINYPFIQMVFFLSIHDTPFFFDGLTFRIADPIQNAIVLGEFSHCCEWTYVSLLPC
jgi:hypothetical protein